MFRPVFEFFKNLLTGIVSAIFEHPMNCIAFFFSCVGGLLAPQTFIGTVVGFIVGLFWMWMPYALLGGSTTMVLGDLIRDGLPERFAIYLPIFIPSFAMAIPEEAPMHQDLSGWMDKVNGWLDTHIGAYIGAIGQEATATILTVLSIVFAVIVCERHGKHKTSTATGNGPGAPAGLRTRRTTP